MEDKYENIKDKIIQELNARAPSLKCPACNSSAFVLGGGYFAHDLQPDLGNRQMGGMNIPTVPIICGTCGCVMEFAAGTLGLLPKKNAFGKEKTDGKITSDEPK